MREEMLTRDGSRRAAKRRAAYLKQFNAIVTATGLALLASALWKPIIEHAARFEPTALLIVAWPPSYWR